MALFNKVFKESVNSQTELLEVDLRQQRVEQCPEGVPGTLVGRPRQRLGVEVEEHCSRWQMCLYYPMPTLLSH